MAGEPKYKIIALVMAIVAAIFTIMAIVQGYAATKRFFANSALDRYTVNHFERDLRGMRSSAQEASGWLGRDARATLPAIDPLEGSADEKLAQLEAQVPPAQRHLVITARNFARAITDRELDKEGQMRGSNADLIKHIVELRSRDHGTVPELPAPDTFMPPDFYILHRALEERVRVAWSTRDQEQIIQATATLWFYDQQHPLATSFEAIAHICKPGYNRRQTYNVIRHRIEQAGDHRRAIARRLIALLATDPGGIDNVDERIKLLLEEIPAGERTARESSLWMRTAGGDLEQMAKSARSSGSEPVVITAINRCFAAGRNDLVVDLAKSLDDSTRRRIRLAVAEREWDLATIKDLAPNPEVFLPVVIRPHTSDGRIVFHVTSPSGAIPDKPLSIKVDGIPVAAEDQQRIGSVVSIPVPDGTGSIDLQVALADTPLFEGSVQR